MIRLLLLIPLLLAAAGDRPAGLAALSGGCPRAFFFRSAEGLAANPNISYEDWERAFERLNGIQGKVLDEEIPGRSKRNIEFFTRFKERHPDQLVLLHYNGRSRDPRWEAGAFFAGHWLYYNGARILEDVPAQAGETDIRVDDATLFRTGAGRMSDKNEDIGLCELTGGGKPDWRASEQAELVSIDRARGVIRVRRGRFGTAPRAFAAGKAYAAAHVYEGPWGAQSNLMWWYNYSTRSPRDANGLAAGEAAAEDLARRFRPGGLLAAFDGVEFDVLMHSLRFDPKAKRAADADADGKPDGGWFDGANTYGEGVVKFLRALRGKVGGGKLILADGMTPNHARGFGVQNGIESEGFPDLRDPELKDWSGGLNRHTFWNARGVAPRFHYINHKFNVGTGPEQEAPDVPWSVHRMVFAAGVFTDAAICYSFRPPTAPGELIGIWDELRMGAENRRNWLGKPLGEARHWVEQSQPVFAREGGSGLRWDNLPNPSGALVAAVTVRAPDTRVYYLEAGEQRYMAWADSAEFTSWFAFHGVEGAAANLRVTTEAGAPVTVTRVRVWQGADVVSREFENGLVIANPGFRAVTVILEQLAPGKRFRRFRGTEAQDPQTNNGALVVGPFELPARDAIFLARASGS